MSFIRTFAAQMYNSRVIRKFERFLFGGVPEQPEPTWERDDNTYVAMRQTGRAQASYSTPDFVGKSEIIGEFVYDFQQEKETFIPVK